MAQIVDHTADLEPGPVNLDGMDQSELYMFIAATRGSQPRRAARRLFRDKLSSVLVTRWLNQYGQMKFVAMACRERGEVETALQYENICERLYNDLPEYARW